jgi:hypothetical protein
VPDPRGGVRHVIPARANYLAQPEAAVPLGLPHQRALVRGGEDPFLPHLHAGLDRARDADPAFYPVDGDTVAGVKDAIRSSSVEA